MKKTKLILGAMMLAAVSAGAVNVDDLRIYINPGHGSWTANDRPMSTIAHGEYNPADPDTTGFFESNTNLWKCFSILDKLREYGLKFDPTLNQDNPNPARRGAALDMRNNIVMSHVKLGPYPVNTGDKNAFNRDLYEIACEVERGNFDFFLSVHSNAHTDGSNTNYPAIFVRGENKVAFSTGSDEVARTFWPYAYQDQHACWSTYSMTSMGIYYDIDFWHGDYLINNIDGKQYKGYYGVLRHGVLGFLCEGYFHTYQPARHRAMNVDVCRHEGTNYAHGLAAIFGLETEKYGELYGIVRDLHETFKHKYYNCSPTSPDAKKPINNALVTLYKDGKEIDHYTTDEEWNGAFVFPRLDPGKYTISVTAPGYKPAHEDFCGPFVIEASKTTYPSVYLENEAYEPPATQYYDYPDEAEGSTAIAPSGSYAFKRSFTEKVFNGLKDKTIRRFISRNDKLYVLALDAQSVPLLMVINADKLTTLRVVETEGCTGSDLILSDIQVTNDGVLIGCAQQQTGRNKGVCNVYRWQNDSDGLPTGAPRLWLTTETSGGLDKAITGRSMAYTGTLEKGKLVISSTPEDASKIYFTVIEVEGEKKSAELVSPGVCMYPTNGDFTMTISPLGSGSVIVNSPDAMPKQYAIDNVAEENVMPDNMSSAVSSQAGFFRFAGRSMMVAPAFDDKNRNTGIELYDISDGLAKAKLIKTTNTDLTLCTGAGAAAGRTDVSRGDDGEVNEAYMVLFTVRNNGKITRLTTKGVEQPVEAGAMAYNLRTVRNADGSFDLNFCMTGKATARIVFIDRITDNNPPTFKLEPQEYQAGENTVKIAADFLPPYNYEWYVEVYNDAIGGCKTLVDLPLECNGVTVINDEAGNFGHVYVALKQNTRGIFEFAPDLTQVNAQAYHAQGWDYTNYASCWRLSPAHGGNLLISDWSDNHSGIFLMNTAEPTQPLVDVFKGTRNTGNGEISYNGAVIGGSTSGLWQLYDRIYTFQEDYPAANSQSFVVYKTNRDNCIDTKPEASYPDIAKLMVNSNVNIYANNDFVFLSQTRSAGNNTSPVPAFVITGRNGNLLFNSGDALPELNGTSGGFAVNNAGNIFAIADANQVIRLYTISRLENSELVLTPFYSFDSGFTTSTYQMAFDAAGRLYVANVAGLKVFVVPQPESVATTWATDGYLISAGVDELEISGDNAPVEYFNLQGMRVKAEALSTGIYIRKQGNHSEKVIIR